MRAVVVGAGPTGLVTAMGLARRGHDVVVVDRDPGPPESGEWQRRGVMQFQHPHFFRQFVREVLLDLLPDVWDGVVAAGGLPTLPDGMPEQMTSLRCRRSTFERVLWSAARREPGLELRVGHADSLIVEGGEARGVVVDGTAIDADVVISTAGRAGRFADDVRAPGEGGDCGVAYVSRMYRALPGAPQPDGFPSGALYRGYLSIVFPQDDGTLSTLIVRDDAADDLSELRHNAAFDAVVPLIPQLAPWTEPSAYEPITDVLVGGRLTNNYRGQLDAHGEIPVSGLYFAGDTVCTTNPSAGRGASLGLLQARELVRLIDGGAADHRATALAFDAWCTEQIRPWYDDHVTTDKTLLERFRGDEPDEHHPITSDVICDAAQDNPSLMPVVGPYLGMLAPPSTLDAARETVRGMLAEGWRPPYGDGPSRADLVDVIGRTVPA